MPDNNVNSKPIVDPSEKRLLAKTQILSALDEEDSESKKEQVNTEKEILKEQNISSGERNEGNLPKERLVDNGPQKNSTKIVDDIPKVPQRPVDKIELLHAGEMLSSEIYENEYIAQRESLLENTRKRQSGDLDLRSNQEKIFKKSDELRENTVNVLPSLDPLEVFSNSSTGGNLEQERLNWQQKRMLARRGFLPDDEKEEISTPKATDLPDYNAIGQGVAPIKTYKDDIRSFIKEGKTSVAEIALAEKSRRNKRSSIKEGGFENDILSQKKTLSFPIIFLIIFISIILITAVIFSYKKFSSTNIVTQPNILTGTTTPTTVSWLFPSIIPINNQEVIDITNSGQNQVLESVKASLSVRSELNYIKEVVLSRKVDDGTAKKVLLKEVLGIWPQKIPDILKFSFSEQYMIGSYTPPIGKTQPFVLMSTVSYDRSFAGMLDWEETMYKDLLILFGNIKNTSQDFIGSFSDSSIDKAHIRLLLNDKNDTILVYGIFEKNKTIIISTGLESFAVLLNSF